MKFLILNGPNINMLGTRQPEIYGEVNYASLIAKVNAAAEQAGVEVAFYQSNHEGDLVDEIQNAPGIYDGIIINPAAYTHTSIAILDALKAVDLPAAEVHISNICEREAFRHISYAGMACQLHYIGQGLDGYTNALTGLKEYITKDVAP